MRPPLLLLELALLELLTAALLLEALLELEAGLLELLTAVLLLEALLELEGVVAALELEGVAGLLELEGITAALELEGVAAMLLELGFSGSLELELGMLELERASISDMQYAGIWMPPKQSSIRLLGVGPTISCLISSSIGPSIGSVTTPWPQEITARGNIRVSKYFFIKIFLIWRNELR